MALKLIFVALTAAFSAAICTDNDPAHPFGPDVVITAGKPDGDPAVFKVAQNTYIKDKIREGILEEVPDFTGTPRNDPEHPDHVDNPDNGPTGETSAVAELAALAGQPRGYTDDDVQGIVAKALAQQAETSKAATQKAIDDAVAKVMAAKTA